MWRLAFALLLCSLALGASAQTTYQPAAPPASSQPKGDGGREQPAEQPQAAAAAPIIVNVQPPSKTEAEAGQEEAERKEKARLDRRLVELTADLATYTKWLAYATIILTVATAGLFAFAVVQARDAKEVGRSARRSADAARLSAASAIAAEGARLLISKVSLDGQAVRTNRDRVRACIVDAHATNYGRSPAFVRKTRIAVFCGDPLPALPRYGNGTPAVDIVLEAREEHRLEPGRPDGGPLGDREVDEVLAGTRTLWAFGYVMYGDVFGSTHTARFCGRFAVSDETQELTWVGGGPAAYTKSG